MPRWRAALPGCCNSGGSAGDGSGREGAQQLLGQVLLVRLEGASPDLEQLRVPEETLHLVLRAVPPSAEDLHRVVGDLLAHRSREQLRRVGAHPVAPVVARLAGDRVDERARSLRLRVALGEVALDLT